MNMRTFHGVFSLLLIVAAVFSAILWLFQTALLAAWIYVIIAAVAPVVVVYSYCAKCPCRFSDCGHVFPGKLTRILPQRESSDYEIGDYLGMLLPLVLLFGYPQYWLWNAGGAFALFWALLLLAGAEIIVYVCKGCRNDLCPVCLKLNPRK